MEDCYTVDLKTSDLKRLRFSHQRHLIIIPDMKDQKLIIQVHCSFFLTIRKETVLA